MSAVSQPELSYDPDRVAAAARAADPGLLEEDAARLARQAWPHLREAGCGDAPEIARRLMDDSQTSATHANVIAKAACDHCTDNGIDPTA